MNDFALVEAVGVEPTSEDPYRKILRVQTPL